MREKQIANKILEHKKYILKPLENYDFNKLRYNLKRQFKIITKILFSDIPNQVSANSPLATNALFDDDTRTNKRIILCTFKGVLSSKIKEITSIRQDYWDDLDDSFDCSSLKLEAIRFIDNLNYIYLDLSKKTKHHVYKDTTNIKALHKFYKEFNNDNKYIVLKIRAITDNHNITNALTHLNLSKHISGFNTNTKSKAIILTYTPRKLMTEKAIKFHKIIMHLEGLRAKKINPVECKLLPQKSSDKLPHILITVSKDMPISKSLQFIPLITKMILQISMVVEKINQHININIDYAKKALDAQVKVIDRPYNNYNKLSLITSLGKIKQLQYESQHSPYLLESDKYTRKVLNYWIKDMIPKLVNKIGKDATNDILRTFNKELGLE